MNLLFDAVLCGLILVAAALALLGRDQFASIAFFIVYGVLVALAWLSLGAVDVALAEAAIGAGVTGVLLIGAWQALSEGDALSPDPVTGLIGRTFAALGCAALALLLGAAVTGLPETPGLAGAVDANQDRLGLGNPVTAVLLGFRGWDTLLESLILTTALIAVWSLTPETLWGGRPGPRHVSQPGGVMATFGRLVPPVGLVVAIYLVWAGADAPGGAFQAGTVLAAVWILIVLTGLSDEPRVSGLALRFALVLGPAVFLFAALAGALVGTPLGYPEGHAKPAILVIEYALTVSIAATLALLIAGVPRRPA